MIQKILVWLENRWIRRAIMAASALLTALTVCFPVLGVLEWVALVPFGVMLFAQVRRERFSFGRSYLFGLGFFMVYYAVIFHWFFYMYPLEFLEMSPVAAAVVVVVACFGLAFLQSVVSALLVPLFLVAARGRLAHKCPLLMPFVAASLWCVAEWAMTLTWAGVPWSRLALGQMEMRAVVQTASLFGSYFITFLIVCVNFLVAYALYYRSKIAVALPMLLFAVNLATGCVLLTVDKTVGEPLQVAVVQGNISSEEKWGDDSLIASLSVYTTYTQQADNNGAALVVWPESAIPHNIEEEPSIDSYLRALAKKTETYMLVGGFKKVDGLDYNAIYTYHPDGTLNETFYFKRRLVPFGEFLPMEGFVRAVIPPLANLNAFENTLEAGTDSNIIKTDIGDIGCLICFDSIYEELVRDTVLDGAEIIALSTNDSWFSDSAALYMHNRQAALRAIESGRYIVRAANTGISAIITPEGEIIDSVKALRKGSATAEVYLRNDLTLYMQIGNVVVWLCIALFVAVVSYDATVRIISKKKRRS